MFELTNEQRKCFGLLPVDSSWTRLILKPSPYDRHTTISYLDGTMLHKYIETGDDTYIEYEICERLSDDLRYLLPKTEKGNPVLISAATLKKRTGIGMCLTYSCRNGYSYFDIHNQISQKCYYANSYETFRSCGIDDFPQWVQTWCEETTADDLMEIAQFYSQSTITLYILHYI